MFSAATPCRTRHAPRGKDIFDYLVSKLENERRQKFQRSKKSARQKRILCETHAPLASSFVPSRCSVENQCDLSMSLPFGLFRSVSRLRATVTSQPHRAQKSVKHTNQMDRLITERLSSQSCPSREQHFTLHPLGYLAHLASFLRGVSSKGVELELLSKGPKEIRICQPSLNQ